MKNDNLRRYIDLRTSLLREKSQLEQRLQQINSALGENETISSASTAQSPTEAVSPQRGAARGRRSPGGLSLREAVLRLTSQRPMTKEEILQGVKGLGYKFTTNNPLNSLGVILYGKNPRFKNENGRFSPAAGAGSTVGNRQTGPATTAGWSAFSRKRRQMSPEARERIAAAQRARWAKTKRGK